MYDFSLALHFRDILAALNVHTCLFHAGLQKSGGGKTAGPVEPAALQNLWEQTKATGGQKTAAIALGAFNVLGIGILGSWQGGLAALAQTNLAFVVAAFPYLTVPLPCPLLQTNIVFCLAFEDNHRYFIASLGIKLTVSCHSSSESCQWPLMNYYMSYQSASADLQRL